MSSILIRESEIVTERLPPIREAIHCNKDQCAIAYILRSDDPGGTIGDENKADVMRRTGAAMIEAEHSHHETKIYEWHDSDQGWLKTEFLHVC